jgi:3'(2'), 5'-bisphosphate nucleotidase
VKQLRNLYPGDEVLSEEAADHPARLGRRRTWIVDPMDGTKEFIARSDEFAVMIGLAVDGESRLGVVYQPTSGKIYYGARGTGAFLETSDAVRSLRVSSESDPRRMTMAISRSHHSETVERLRGRLGIPAAIRSGSLGLKAGLICEGLAHLYVNTSRRTSIWDTCAPEAIVREAGGRTTDLRNLRFRYDRAEIGNLDGVIVSNGSPVHEEVGDEVRRIRNESP